MSVIGKPLDPPRPRPEGGWPRGVIRLELVDCPLNLLAYELACSSRRYFQGVVAEFDGVDVYAFPHQEVDEIQRAYVSQRRLLHDELADPPPPGCNRWSPKRKLWVVLSIKFNRIERGDIVDAYAITEEEIMDWTRRYEEFGIVGLSAHSVQKFAVAR